MSLLHPLSPPGLHCQVMKLDMRLPWETFVHCTQVTATTKVLNVSLELNKVEPPWMRQRVFEKLTCPAQVVPWETFSTVSQCLSNHHLPPFFPCSWLFPGHLQHFLLHLDTPKHCKQSFGNRQKPKILFHCGFWPDSTHCSMGCRSGSGPLLISPGHWVNNLHFSLDRPSSILHIAQLLHTELLIAGLLLHTLSAAVESTVVLGHGMSSSSPVCHLEDVQCWCFQPVCNLSFWLFEGHKPLEGRVGSSNSKGRAAHVAFKVANCSHNHKKFSVSHRESGGTLCYGWIRGQGSVPSPLHRLQGIFLTTSRLVSVCWLFLASN